MTKPIGYGGWEILCDVCGSCIDWFVFESSREFHESRTALCSNECIDVYCLNPLPYGDKKVWSRLERAYKLN